MKKTNQNDRYTLAKVLAAVGGAALVGSAAAAAVAWNRGRKAERKPRAKALPKPQSKVQHKVLPESQPKALPIPQPQVRRTKQRHSSRGFSLAEVLLVVAILMVLGAVAIVSLVHHQRNLERLKLDNIAREIFVAAQNHLIEAKSQGYLGKDEFGTEERDGEKPTGIYYYVIGAGDGTYTNPDANEAGKTLLPLMLPFASVDETVRMGGSYIIRYQKETAMVLDVFYAEKNGHFGYTYTPTDYSTLLSSYKGDDNQAARRNASFNGGTVSGRVVGWYGGEGGEAPTDDALITLLQPEIIIHNEDTLWVEVVDRNKTLSSLTTDQYEALQRKLIVTGLTSGSKRSVVIPAGSGVLDGLYESTTQYDKYRFTLDDITTDGKHFREQFCASSDVNIQNLTPGENIRVSIRIDSSMPLVIGADGTSEPVTNSLYDTNSFTGTETKTALISYFRHLENLDAEISGLADTVTLEIARQTKDLNWTATVSGWNWSEKTILTVTARGAGEEGKFLPVYPRSDLEFKGMGFKISNLQVSTAEDHAGLFGKMTGGAVYDLTLEDPVVLCSNAAGYTGAVAGEAVGTDFNNVLVYNKEEAKNAAVLSAYRGARTGSGLPMLWIGGLNQLPLRDGTEGAVKAGEPSLRVSGFVSGGLVGWMNGGSVNFSAASVFVRADGSGCIAGGLAGKITGTVDIRGSYSGGHTVDADYTGSPWNVKANAGTAGGLIGDASGATSLAVEKSYTTCSASGSIAGGFLGKSGDDAGKVTLTNTYSTGRVSGTTKEDLYVAEGILTWAGDNRYISFGEENDNGVIVRYQVSRFDNGGNTSPLTGVRTEDWSKYPDFVVAERASANPYDEVLGDRYSYKYFFPTIQQLYGGEFNGAFNAISETGVPKAAVVHYGDWHVPIPVPMNFVWDNGNALRLVIDYEEYADKNNGSAPDSVVAAVTGSSSGVTRVFRLKKDGDSYTIEKEGYLNAGEITWLDTVSEHKPGVTFSADEKKINLTFDDIRNDDSKFSTVMCSAGSGKDFTPGENLTARVSLMPTWSDLMADYSVLTNEQKAASVTNSLFAYNAENWPSEPVESDSKTAYIANLRHLQNLDAGVSSYVNATSLSANQVADIDLTESSSQTFWNGYSYKPVDTAYTLSYTGVEGADIHSITGVTIAPAANTNAGIFGTLDAVDSVTGLELVDITVTASGSGNAGALAGSSGGTVTGVLARSENCQINSASGSAGGLIGSVTGGTISKSAAAVYVRAGSSSAGGLIGSAVAAGGTITVSDSYSGGHTSGGKYTIANVSAAGIAGGLIGNAKNVTVTNAYSTCSAHTSGTTAGGLIGVTEDVTLSNCYSVGLVQRTGTSAVLGTLIGQSSTTKLDSNCACLDVDSYYQANIRGYTPHPPVGSGSLENGGNLIAMDGSVSAFNAWAPQTEPAKPYDSTLTTTYNGKYDFKTISQLNSSAAGYDWLTTHYGDWSALETLVENTAG